MNNYPKIGIRPAIDARAGVRESLEAQTLNMAKSVAALLSGNLKYPDGTPVECIISDGTIGRVAEAAACEDRFLRENVGLSITVSPCWCYGTETIDMNPTRPKAIYGFNGTERPGAVYLAAALAGHNQKGLPAFSIYGQDVRDSSDTEIPRDVADKLLTFAKAGLAVAQMKGRSYLSIGGVSMGIAGSVVDDSFFCDYLGMRNESVDMCELSRRIEKGIYDKEEYKRAITWVRANCIEGEDRNPADKQYSREEKDAHWEYCVKMALITKDLMQGNDKLKDDFAEESLGHNAILAGFQGQRQWTDYLPNGDFMEAILCSSFDWNGRRAPILLATENDSLNGASMLFGYLLTNTAQIFCDVRTYWSVDSVKRVTGKALSGRGQNGFIHLINSGAAALDGCGEQKENGESVIKPFWQITDDEADRCLKATRWCPANLGYFRGGGFSSAFRTKGEMPMTMVRINLVKGVGPVLQIAEGYSVDLPDDIHDIIDKRTDPTWPTTYFAPNLTSKGAFTDVYSVMASWGANHCSLSYGHIGGELIALASMLRIPVCMHNVPDKKIFRPSAWAAFGTEDRESADFRACKAYGALYE
ncbi:MAG: L-fucose isomerase [Firmicutes bacterium HGW-Firmicutes-21]|nr:MAG: L-fucose isomerase [Firmicutes bacterium HGW-Firmicutes-21]